MLEEIMPCQSVFFVLFLNKLIYYCAFPVKVMCSRKYSSFAGGMPISHEISCDHFVKCSRAITRFDTSRLLTYLPLRFIDEFKP